MRIAGAVEEELLRAMYQAAPVPRATGAAAIIVPTTLKTPVARAGQRTIAGDPCQARKTAQNIASRIDSNTS
jgi:hypothetical protein